MLKNVAFILLTFLVLAGAVVVIPLVVPNLPLGGAPRSILAPAASVAKSFNGGESWFEKIRLDTDRTLKGVSILDLAIDVKDPNRLFLGTRGNGLFRSDDGGESWRRVFDFFGVLDPSSSVFEIAIDQRDRERLYLATSERGLGKVFKSEDGGQSFREVYITPVKNVPIFAVAIHPTDPRVLYMGTGQGGIFQSIDFGETWQVLRWVNDPVIQLIISPSNPRILWALTRRNGLWMSRDAGLSWSQILEEWRAFPRASETVTMAVDPRSADTLYVGSNFGLLRTRDGGASWQEVSGVWADDSLPVRAITVDPGDSRVLYAGVNSLVYKSSDGGSRWETLSLRTSRRIGVVRVHPKDSKILWAGMSEAGIEFPFIGDFLF